MSLEHRPPDVPWYRSCRVLLAFITAWGYVFFYLLRIDLSLAIVCMVRDPRIAAGHDNTSHHADNQSTASTISAAATVTSSVHQLLTVNSSTPELLSTSHCGTLESGASIGKYTGELMWSKEIRGHVLSSFFYGYIVTQVLGGWLASRYGAKHVFGVGILITIIATMLVPVAARAHVGLLIALRVIMGLACGVGIPATHHLFAQWLPPLERSRLMGYSYAGTFIGTILALVFSGLLCESGLDNGWPLIFYVYGGVSFVWWILWNIFVYSSPETHPRIDPVEKNYIMTTVGNVAYEHDRKIPWLSIVRSGPVWAIITAHTCHNWGNYTILICIPMYMKEVLKFDVKQNGLLSSLPHVVSYVSAVMSGELADLIRRRKICSTTVTRKLFQSISSGVPAVFIACMGFIDCELRYVAVTILCLTFFINTCSRAGFVVNHVDISPKHAGVLFGISNTIGTIPGFLAPTLAGLLTPNGSREEWMNVFFICSGFYVFSTIVYAVLASGVEQPWAKSKDAKTELELEIN